MRLQAVFALLNLVVSCVAQTRVCNNAAALCSRTYDNITHLGAHDSPYVRTSANSYSVAGNQVYTSLQQLDSGVRLLSAQVHRVAGSNGQNEYRLCHSLCQLYDAGLLVNWLKDIKSWMDRNPNDVITILIVNADNADASTLGSIYREAGLDAYSYQPASTTTRPTRWPTLNDMITQNKRLVNFVADLTPTTNTAAPYLLNEFTFLFENKYENFNPSDFSCEPDRPSTLNGNTATALSSNYLPLQNHFRYSNISGFSVPNVDAINITNGPSGSGPGNLGDSAAVCASIYNGRAPSFILVDFANVGPAMVTVDRLNRVEGQTAGRLLLPSSYADSIANPSPSGSSQGVASATGSMVSSGSASSTTRPSTAVSGTSSSAAASSGAGNLVLLPVRAVSVLQALVLVSSLVSGVCFLLVG